MARKRKAPEHANHERWLVSYADFITLLFAFFTTMYAISTVDAQKMGRMVISMRAAFDSTMFGVGSDTLSLSNGNGAAPALSRDLMEFVDTPKDKVLPDYRITNLKELKTNFLRNALPRGEVIALSKLKKRIEDHIAARKMEGKVETRLEERGLVISLGEGGFFDSGSDLLKPEGRELLDNLASDLTRLQNQIRVEGHTDDVPIQTVRFPSNWELSTARATSIVAYFVSRYRFTPKQLSAAGYGEFRPIDTNSTPEGRARNRRVDIIVLNSRYITAEPR